MKNGLLRFYLVFMFVSLALFSCENRDLSSDAREAKQSIIDRKPDMRHPVEPNEAPAEPQKGKKSRGKYISRSSNWC
ncbi:hypothetical protein DOM21_16190 [Bacteriovorax stolpii]|uniref:Uncharacterized protein n=1 Tax=Bacteriovorax stolpii TaxID=960 RepID=A0A2K9NNN2_BACTC|nr:hypothetical protein [Bacteriovorax stolpii]AUN97102.1 hypothetical protein C0V70_03055 [Bacteriovorax stolpii]QDK42963.1 hypothetical protein DOM21_16190 [Bacteriovorax stolpii]TDP53388.1 hypothetical protein C8D79_2031 [Bacteriovorax stolpii]BDT27134.1 hypothetical protein BHI3_06000 [Bacteriovorax sp. HI3]